MHVPIARLKIDVDIEPVCVLAVVGPLVEPEHGFGLSRMPFRFIELRRGNLPISMNQIRIYGEHDQASFAI